MRIIVAVDENWNIGADNALLYSIAEDLKRFRRLTAGKTVIMGRKTLESFPSGKPLPKRRNIVLSHSAEIEGAEMSRTIAQARAMVRGETMPYIIGGESIYRAFLPYCRVAQVTKILQTTENADAAFPDLDAMAEWRLIKQSPVQIGLDRNSGRDVAYQYCTYVRVQW